MQQLLQRKFELEKQINSYQPPLFYTQVLKRDRLIKELKEIRFKIMRYENAKIRSEQTVKTIHN